MEKKLSRSPSPSMVGMVNEMRTLGAIVKIKNDMLDGATITDLHPSYLEAGVI